MSRFYRSLRKYDRLDGRAFELACAELLRRTGCRNVEVTPASRDYGIDILAGKGLSAYAVQCKCFGAPVGVSAVQQAYSGSQYYGNYTPVVLTNSTFTPQAVKLAEELGVRLWDRKHLKKLITGAKIRRRILLLALAAAAYFSYRFYLNTII